ncbi:MAG TPA: DUF47 domain-containing protein [Candidatus Marinimicrobia bacterium]|nr:MAG: hypothetical protein AUJ47_03710 [Candidatus Marinimicrobia bacterium CG1_02_48_14]HCW75083.1 DUF47 domain-containing protein [Candidatus Neomarinimicrobiota bacterium]
MLSLFKKTKMLENKMDDFLDHTSESSMVFYEAVKHYFLGTEAEFKSQVAKIYTLEHEADTLRREIENQLYTETLIPESRGDVLALLENTDNVINQVKGTIADFEIERPEIPPEYTDGFLKLTGFSGQAVDKMVKSIRAFIRNPQGVKDWLHKVYFYEKEADNTAENLKRKIFQSDLPLAQKNHIRYFLRQIDSVADRAEDVADRLAIYTIKRSI